MVGCGSDDGGCGGWWLQQIVDNGSGGEGWTRCTGLVMESASIIGPHIKYFYSI